MEKLHIGGTYFPDFYDYFIFNSIKKKKKKQYNLQQPLNTPCVKFAGIFEKPKKIYLHETNWKKKLENSKQLVENRLI